MEQEQNFFDQMRASWKSVREVIVTYNRLKTALEPLALEEVRLKESIASVENEIRSIKQKGLINIRAEHDQLHAELSEQIEPLARALEEAKSRVKGAESEASASEASARERVVVANAAAEAAEKHLTEVRETMAVLTAKLVS
jgi:chromosome segregation ATPase